jgi:hypothetical protein
VAKSTLSPERIRELRERYPEIDRVRREQAEDSAPRKQGKRVPEATIVEIRRRAAAGVRIVDIARDLSLDQSTVGRIVRGERYPEVGEVAKT